MTSLIRSALHIYWCVPRGWGGETPQKFGWGWVAHSLHEALTLSQTSLKKCDFSYPIWDLTLYFRPAQELLWFAKAFENGIKFAILIKTHFSREDNNKVASSKNQIIQFQIRLHKPYPISDQNGQNLYPISD